jgi:serine/threonine-protein kinase RsbW
MRSRPRLQPRSEAEYELHLGRDLGGLKRLHSWVTQLAREEGIGPEMSYRLDLCLHETVVNVICHALQPDGSDPVLVRFRRDGGSVLLEVEDDGSPFDPTTHPPPPPPRRLEDLPVGSYGLPLIRHFTDGLEYERTEGRNRLRLVFRPRRG